MSAGRPRAGWPILPILFAAALLSAAVGAGLAWLLTSCLDAALPLAQGALWPAGPAPAG